MLHVLLIILLFAIFGFFLYRWNRHHAVHLSAAEIFAAYALKVLLGCAYGYIFLTWYGGDDTWYFHNGSLEEQRKLLNDPWQFFADLNPVPAFQRNEGFVEGWYFYLSDLEFWLLSKPMAIFNFISQGNYYVNVVFFCFVTIWANIWLFRLYVTEFPGKRTAILITLFFLPTLVFWLSGIRGDGLLVFFLGLLLIRFQQWLTQPRIRLLLPIIIALIGITILRSTLLFLLAPALLSWFISVRFKTRVLVTALVVYTTSLLLFFGSALISPQHNLPNIIVAKQQSYLKLKASTRFHLDTLEATPGSFLRVLPQAANNTFLRPYLWEWKGILQLAAAIETLLLLLLLALYVVNRETNGPATLRNPLLFFPLLFGISLYLFIGYTVPFPGAIVRYKIPGEIFLVLPFVIAVNWRRFVRLN
jgi:hypothetical protein